LGNGATPSERIAPLLSCVHTFDKLTGADAWYEPPGRRLEWVGVSFDPDLVMRVRVKRGEPWLLLAKEDRGGVQVLRRPLAPHAPRSSPWRAQSSDGIRLDGLTLLYVKEAPVRLRLSNVPGMDGSLELPVVYSG